MDIEQINFAIKKHASNPDTKFMSLVPLGVRARERGFFKKKEFLEICQWKSSMRMDLCRKNSGYEIRKHTKAAFSTADLRAQMESLIKLKGVAVPRASAILAVSDPESYGVIDVRAWRCLYLAKLVNLNSSGKSLSVNNWIDYVSIIRRLARNNKTTPRLVEFALYQCHGEKYRIKNNEPIYKDGDNCVALRKCRRNRIRL